jgi:predicted nucleic acid-binding protein
MSYLIDTDWVADYLRGRTRATERLQALQPQGLGISIITFGEIYEGIYFGADPERNEQGFRQFLRSVDCSPLTGGLCNASHDCAANFAARG